MSTFHSINKSGQEGTIHIVTYQCLPINLPMPTYQPTSAHLSTYQCLPINLPVPTYQPISAYLSTYQCLPINLPVPTYQPTSAFLPTYQYQIVRAQIYLKLFFEQWILFGHSPHSYSCDSHAKCSTPSMTLY